jgi:hypothetical protein
MRAVAATTKIVLRKSSPWRGALAYLVASGRGAGFLDCRELVRKERSERLTNGRQIFCALRNQERRKNLQRKKTHDQNFGRERFNRLKSCGAASWRDYLFWHSDCIPTSILHTRPVRCRIEETTEPWTSGRIAPVTTNAGPGMAMLSGHRLASRQLRVHRIRRGSLRCHHDIARDSAIDRFGGYCSAAPC